MFRTALVIGVLVGLIGCGDVTQSSGSGSGNDVPPGPALASAGQNDCTRPTGAGVDATVTPGTGGSPGQGDVMGVPSAGLDPLVQPCFDFQSQALTPGGVSLTNIAFTIRDGVVQAPSNTEIRIVTQWFSWDEPMPGTCQAQVDAVVEVTDSGITCAAQIVFGDSADAPIYSYVIQ